MELNEQGFMDELLALRRDSWGTIPVFPTEMNHLYFSSGWNYGCLDENPAMPAADSFCQGLSSEQQGFSSYFSDVHEGPFGEEFAALQYAEAFSVPQLIDSSHNTLGTPPFPGQEGKPMSPAGLLATKETHNLDMQATCKSESIQSPEQPAFNIGPCPERRVRGKKIEGQPSKNLMAERRRRKRLNDRFSMLRSIVPRISKTDRTSILRDTIDYMKELLERINILQEEMHVDSNDFDIRGIVKDTKANELIVRNSPKFDVERRNLDTRIEICCTAKPGLLLSTVTALETLGLEIRQCVFSCFNDFAMQASCKEESEQQQLFTSEDIRQALHRSAGYGGRCL